jgi:hypothetical protein
MSKFCAVRAVTAVLLAPCHWVAIAEDVSKQCITVILTSKIGVEFFTPSFPILFETSFNTPANTQQNPVNNIFRDSFSCTLCNAALGALHRAGYSALRQTG